MFASVDWFFKVLLQSHFTCFADIAAAEQLSSKSTDVALQPIPEAEKAEVVLSKEDKAAAARERFLARKRKTPG